jgi:glycosyltransferase involved in cell wall biosynthesis
LFDPFDGAAMVQALVRIVEDEPLRRRLEEAGPRRAAQFSWRATAEATLEALTAAAEAIW